ncbi:MAG: hypothetical protein FWG31_06360 [Oscillospiraceae bacterium]|nr:hypothetical protein [Oscillospiraceae bacterium]
MRRYKLTGRGWAMAVVCAALLFLGTYALVSLTSGGSTDDPSETPSDDPFLQNTPSLPSSPSEEPSADPSEEPSVELPPVAPSAEPSEVPSAEPSIEPSAAPSAEPSPSPVPSPVPSPLPSEPPPLPPSWKDESTAIMFGFNSADMFEPELAISDLIEILPSAEELIEAGYVVIVTAFVASDEDTEDLARLRAEAVHGLLMELGIPESSIRLYADPISAGTERYRQRANVAFMEVGSK